MLEKLAEMVREDMKEANDTYGLLPCAACDGRPAESEKCRALGRPCPEMQDHSGSLMLARWAVLLVAKWLEKECKGYQGEIAKDAFVRDTAIMLLITEAKGDTNDAV